ncbi:MAG: alpha/beta hydrolase [Rhizobiales bacterium]|nr:alpha/beta hydrolase [Hyphomicrobiales bacterium]
MPEVIFNGPSGRLEGRYQPAKEKTAPIAIILHPHPHPSFGGTMNNKIVYDLFYMFQERGFTTLRFNFRGVGRSQGDFDHGHGELSDAAAALDWIQGLHPDSRGCWVAGFSFGAWIGMQLLMRRPEIEGFMSIAPQANLYDFSFLAPCPSSGLIINGDADRVAPMDDTIGLVEKLKLQKGIMITHNVVEGANHFFTEQEDELIEECGTYLDKRLGRIKGGVEETMLLR